MLETTVQNSQHSSNPACVISVLTVSSPGNYKCYLCEYSDERTFVVNGERKY